MTSTISRRRGSYPPPCSPAFAVWSHCTFSSPSSSSGAGMAPTMTTLRSVTPSATSPGWLTGVLASTCYSLRPTQPYMHEQATRFSSTAGREPFECSTACCMWQLRRTRFSLQLSSGLYCSLRRGTRRHSPAGKMYVSSFDFLSMLSFRYIPRHRDIAQPVGLIQNKNLSIDIDISQALPSNPTTATLLHSADIERKSKRHLRKSIQFKLTHQPPDLPTLPKLCLRPTGNYPPSHSATSIHCNPIPNPRASVIPLRRIYHPRNRGLVPILLPRRRRARTEEQACGGILFWHLGCDSDLFPRFLGADSFASPSDAR